MTVEPLSPQDRRRALLSESLEARTAWTNVGLAASFVAALLAALVAPLAVAGAIAAAGLAAWVAMSLRARAAGPRVRVARAQWTGELRGVLDDEYELPFPTIQALFRSQPVIARGPDASLTWATPVDTGTKRTTVRLTARVDGTHDLRFEPSGAS